MRKNHWKNLDGETSNSSGSTGRSSHTCSTISLRAATAAAEKKDVEPMIIVFAFGLAITHWASPSLFVLSEDESLRVCINYTHLNGVTVRGSYRFLRMNEFIGSLGEGSTFSTSDPKSTY